MCNDASVNRYCFPFLVIFLSLLACADHKGQQVLIDRVEPETWTVGTTVQIVGSGFGHHIVASEDSAEETAEVSETNHGLYLDVQLMDALHWTDDRITFSVPEGMTGETYIMVWNKSHASNAYPVSITDPPEESSANTTDPNDSN